MYKFICANIAKSRNFTNSYKKLTQTKKIHQDSSRPQTPAPTQSLQENAEDAQECDENGGQTSCRPSTSPSQMRTFPIVSKLPSLKTIQQATPLKMKECPKFYTGNFIIVDPPTPSISKKYYHVYSINSSTTAKRSYGSIYYRRALTGEAKDNYTQAMKNLNEIQQNKYDYQFKSNPSSKASSIASDPWLKRTKKKSSKTDISYPTHTIKHNLTLTKRYKIREGSVERKIKDLEEQFKTRKKLQTKIFKNMAKKITYPTLVEQVKKRRFVLPTPARSENKIKTVYNWQNNNGTLIKVINNRKQKIEEEAQALQENEETTKQEELDKVEEDFQSLVKSHPTIENASKEVKMKLKTKFIQLLLRSTKRPTPVKTSTEDDALKEIEYEAADSNEAANEVEAFEGERQMFHEKDPETSPTLEKDETQNIITHPHTLSEQQVDEDYRHLRYPKRVWIDNTPNYDVEKVCIKETATKTGSGLISRDYGKEPPKPNYQKVEEEAQELSSFVKKFKKVQRKSDYAIHKLKRGMDPPENLSVKLEELKQERLKFIRELDKLNVRLGRSDVKEHKDSDVKQKSVPNTVKQKEHSERLRKILTGQIKGYEVAQNKKTINQKQDRREEARVSVSSERIPTTEQQPRQLREKLKYGQERMKALKAKKKSSNDLIDYVRKENQHAQKFLSNKPKQPVGKKTAEATRASVYQSEQMGDSAYELDKPRNKTPSVKPTTSKTLEEMNKVNVVKTVSPKKKELAEKGLGNVDVLEKSKQRDNTSKSLRADKQDDALRQRTTSKASVNKPDKLREKSPLLKPNTSNALEEMNKFNVLNTVSPKKKELSENKLENVDAREKSKRGDNNSKSLCTEKEDDAMNERTTPKDSDVSSKQQKVLLAQETSRRVNDRLEEPSNIEELNELAREREEDIKRWKSEEEGKRKQKELENKIEAAQDTKIKANSFTEESDDIDVNSKQQEVQMAQETSRTRNDMLEEPSRVDELNEVAKERKENIDRRKLGQERKRKQEDLQSKMKTVNAMRQNDTLEEPSRVDELNELAKEREEDFHRGKFEQEEKKKQDGTIKADSCADKLESGEPSGRMTVDLHVSKGKPSTLKETNKVGMDNFAPREQDLVETKTEKEEQHKSGTLAANNGAKLNKAERKIEEKTSASTINNTINVSTEKKAGKLERPGSRLEEDISANINSNKTLEETIKRGACAEKKTPKLDMAGSNKKEESNKKTLEEAHKVDILDNFVSRNEELRQKAEKSDVSKKVKSVDKINIFPKVENEFKEKGILEGSPVGPKQQGVLSLKGATDAPCESLEELTKYDELNEVARERVESFHRHKMTQQERKRREEMKKKVQSLPSLKPRDITPRVDKLVDHLDEKFEIAEKCKRKIEDIAPERTSLRQEVIRQRTKSLARKETKPVSTLEESSMYDKLNQTAQHLNKLKKQQELNKGYSLEQPRDTSSTLPDKLGQRKIQETERQIEQEEKVKENLEQFHKKKTQEWNRINAKDGQGVNAETSKTEKNVPGHIKIQENLLSAKEETEGNAVEQYLQENHITLMFRQNKECPMLDNKKEDEIAKKTKASDEKKQEEAKEKTDDDQEDIRNREVKEEHHGFALYPGYKIGSRRDGGGGKNQLLSKNEETDSSGSSHNWNPKGFPILVKQRDHSTKATLSQVITENKKSFPKSKQKSIPELKGPGYPKNFNPSSKSSADLDKQTINMKKAMDSMDTKKVVSSFVQVGFPDNKEIENPKGSSSASNDCRIFSKAAEGLGKEKVRLKMTTDTLENKNQKNQTPKDAVETEKQFLNLKKVLGTLESKKMVSPTFQESVPEIKRIKYPTDETRVLKEFKQQVLNKCFDSKMLSDSQQTIYMPKETLVVGDIRNIEDNKSLSKGDKKSIQKASVEAVLRPGDEIVILEKNPSEQKKKLDAQKSKPPVLNLNFLDTALNIRRELAVSEDIALQNTKKEIDEMMEKINDLQMKINKSELGLTEEKKSENKPRIVPPKPPIEKEKKDIKKEKPKGPKDMILPPKVRGSKPDIPKEYSKAENITNVKIELTKKEHCAEMPFLVLTENQKFKIVSPPNIESENTLTKGEAFTEALREFVRQEKLDDLTKDVKNTSKKKVDVSRLKPTVEKNDEATRKQQCELKENASHTIGKTTDPHTEKVRKYFQMKFGSSSNTNKKPQLIEKATVDRETKKSTSAANMETKKSSSAANIESKKSTSAVNMETKKSVSITVMDNSATVAKHSITEIKKIVKAPKSKSMTITRVELENKAPGNRLETRKHKMLKPRKWPSHVGAGNKMSVKTHQDRPVSCPSASVRASKLASTQKSTGNKKMSPKASSHTSKAKIGMRETKTKYSSWSIQQSRSGQNINGASENTAFLKKPSTDETNGLPWRRIKRSASDKSRNEDTPRKPKVIMNPPYFKKSADKQSAKAEEKSYLEDADTEAEKHDLKSSKVSPKLHSIGMNDLQETLVSKDGEKKKEPEPIQAESLKQDESSAGKESAKAEEKSYLEDADTKAEKHVLKSTKVSSKSHLIGIKDLQGTLVSKNGEKKEEPESVQTESLKQDESSAGKDSAKADEKSYLEDGGSKAEKYVLKSSEVSPKSHLIGTDDFQGTSVSKDGEKKEEPEPIQAESLKQDESSVDKDSTKAEEKLYLEDADSNAEKHVLNPSKISPKSHLKGMDDLQGNSMSNDGEKKEEPEPIQDAGLKQDKASSNPFTALANPSLVHIEVVKDKATVVPTKARLASDVTESNKKQEKSVVEQERVTTKLSDNEEKQEILLSDNNLKQEKLASEPSKNIPQSTLTDKKEMVTEKSKDKKKTNEPNAVTSSLADHEDFVPKQSKTLSNSLANDDALQDKQISEPLKAVPESPLAEKDFLGLPEATLEQDSLVQDKQTSVLSKEEPDSSLAKQEVSIPEDSKALADDVSEVKHISEHSKDTAVSLTGIKSVEDELPLEQPKVFWPNQKVDQKSFLTKGKSSEEQPVLELANILERSLAFGVNEEQEKQSLDSPKALPKVFWSDKSVLQQTALGNKNSKKAKKVTELSKVISDGSAKNKQIQQDDISGSSQPKVFWADKNLKQQTPLGDKKLKKDKSVLELSQALQASNEINIKKRHRSNEPKSSPNMLWTEDNDANGNKKVAKDALQSKKRETLLRSTSADNKKTGTSKILTKLGNSVGEPKSCMADNNLRQDNPIGVLNVLLPRQEYPKVYHGKKLPVSPTEAQVLSGKRNSGLGSIVDLDTGNKLSKAGISTTPIVKNLNDKNFTGPRKGMDGAPEKNKEQKAALKDDKEKTAIFRIQYDGEVFIIKKAGESFGERKGDEKKEVLTKNNAQLKLDIEKSVMKETLSKAEPVVNIQPDVNISVKRSLPVIRQNSGDLFFKKQTIESFRELSATDSQATKPSVEIKEKLEPTAKLEPVVNMSQYSATTNPNPVNKNVVNIQPDVNISVKRSLPVISQNSGDLFFKRQTVDSFKELSATDPQATKPSTEIKQKWEPTAKLEPVVNMSQYSATTNPNPVNNNVVNLQPDVNISVKRSLPVISQNSGDLFFKKQTVESFKELSATDPQATKPSTEIKQKWEPTAKLEPVVNMRQHSATTNPNPVNNNVVNLQPDVNISVKRSLPVISQNSGDLFFKRQTAESFKELSATDSQVTKPSTEIKQKSEPIAKFEPVLNMRQHSATINPNPVNNSETQNTKPKLIAKVEKIIVNPVKENKTEGMKKQKSEIILNKYGSAEDDLSYSFQSSLVFPKAYIKAKIITIYDKDSSSELRENRNLKKFNRFLVNDIKPNKWKPLFGDLGADNFQKIKADFFEHGPSEDFIRPPSTSNSDPILKKHCEKIKVENAALRGIFAKNTGEHIEKNVETNSPKEEGIDEKSLKRTHTVNVNNIDKSLTERRKNVEFKAEKIKQATNVSDGLPKDSSPANDKLKRPNTHDQNKSPERPSPKYASTLWKVTKPIELKPRPESELLETKQRSKPIESKNTTETVKTVPAADIKNENKAVEYTKPEVKMVDTKKEKPLLAVESNKHENIKPKIAGNDRKQKSSISGTETPKVLNNSEKENSIKNNLKLKNETVYKSQHAPEIFVESTSKLTKLRSNAYVSRDTKDIPLEKDSSQLDIDPFKDISYHGSVQSDCVAKPEDTAAKETKKKSGDMYSLNVPKASENNIDNLRNNNKGSMYTLNIPKAAEPVPKSENIEAGKDTLPKRNSTVDNTPQNAQTKEELKEKPNVLETSKSAVLQYEPKTFNEPRLNSKIAVSAPNPKAIKITENKSATDVSIKGDGKVKTEEVTDKGSVKKVVSNTIKATKSIKTKINRKSVEKLILQENLASEIKAWTSNISEKVDDTRSNNILENINQKGPLEASSVSSARSHIVEKQPLNGTQSEQAKTAKDSSPVDKSVRKETTKPDGTTTITIHDESSKKKYQISEEDKFMSVNKSIRKQKKPQAKPHKKTPDTVPVNKWGGPKTYTYVTREEQEKMKKKEEFKKKGRKSMEEQHVTQQGKRSKKDKVESMNDAAKHILMNQDKKKCDEMLKGTRRQHMYQNDAKVIQPSVGNGPWGNKIKIPTSPNDDKKNLHNGPNITSTPNGEKLMSRSEFLRLKKLQADLKAQGIPVETEMELYKQKANDQPAASDQIMADAKTKTELKEKEMRYNIKEINKNLTQETKKSVHSNKLGMSSRNVSKRQDVQKIVRPVETEMELYKNLAEEEVKQELATKSTSPKKPLPRGQQKEQRNSMQDKPITTEMYKQKGKEAETKPIDVKKPVANNTNLASDKGKKVPPQAEIKPLVIKRPTEYGEKLFAKEKEIKAIHRADMKIVDSTKPEINNENIAKEKGASSKEIKTVQQTETNSADSKKAAAESDTLAKEIVTSGKDNKTQQKAKINLQNLGEELQKYLHQSDKTKSKTEPNLLKGKDVLTKDKPDDVPKPENDKKLLGEESKKHLYKKIEQEIETKVKPRPDSPRPELSDESLYFKVTKMAQMFVDDIKANDYVKGTLKEGTNIFKNLGVSEKTAKSGNVKPDVKPTKIQNINVSGTESKNILNLNKDLRQNLTTPKIQSAPSEDVTDVNANRVGAYFKCSRMKDSDILESLSEKTQIATPVGKVITAGAVSIRSLEFPSYEERQAEINRMIELKRKNKMARRLLKSANVKNMQTLPSDKNTNRDKKTDVSPPTAGINVTTDKEETDANILKGANFILKPQPPPRRRPKTTTELKTTPKHQPCKIEKPYCKKILLPLRNPQLTIRKLLECYESTLDKPLSDKIKTVPKEMLEMEEKAKKILDDIKKSDPLAKYRHLKITYMTVTRPAKKRDEKFLPSVVKKFEGREMSEEETNKIINFRFELLRRLNEEFKRQLAEQSDVPKPPQPSDSRKAPFEFDSLEVKDAKNDLGVGNQNDNNMNNVAKILGEVKPVFKGNFENGSSKSAKPKTRNKKDGKKNVFGSSKYDGNDKNEPGGTRKYSTDSDKCVGSDNKDESSDPKSEKPVVRKLMLIRTRQMESPEKCETEDVETSKCETDIGQEKPHPGESASATLKGSTEKSQSKVAEPPKKEFDIAKEVPHAFECPSPKLEEERQKDLYYRYHKMSWADIHQYLGPQRAFAVNDAAQKKEQEQPQKSEPTKTLENQAQEPSKTKSPEKALKKENESK